MSNACPARHHSVFSSVSLFLLCTSVRASLSPAAVALKLTARTAKVALQWLILFPGDVFRIPNKPNVLQVVVLVAQVAALAGVASIAGILSTVATPTPGVESDGEKQCHKHKRDGQARDIKCCESDICFRKSRPRHCQRCHSRSGGSFRSTSGHDSAAHR